MSLPFEKGRKCDTSLQTEPRQLDCHVTKLTNLDAGKKETSTLILTLSELGKNKADENMTGR